MDKQLKELSKEEFIVLKNTGMLWEFYPEAPDTWENLHFKNKNETTKLYYDGKDYKIYLNPTTDIVNELIEKYNIKNYKCVFVDYLDSKKEVYMIIYRTKIEIIPICVATKEKIDKLIEYVEILKNTKNNRN